MAEVVDLCSDSSDPDSSETSTSLHPLSSSYKSPLYFDIFINMTGSEPLQGEFEPLLGPEWSLENVITFAKSTGRAHLISLLKLPPVRPLELAEGFLPTESNAGLSQKHLYGVLVYTRGDIEHEDPCYRCDTEDEAIFRKCVSHSDKAHCACASDLWFRAAQECIHHTKNVALRVSDEEYESNDKIGRVNRRSERGIAKLDQDKDTKDNSLRVVTRTATRKSLSRPNLLLLNLSSLDSTSPDSQANYQPLPRSKAGKKVEQIALKAKALKQQQPKIPKDIISRMFPANSSPSSHSALHGSGYYPMFRGNINNGAENGDNHKRNSKFDTATFLQQKQIAEDQDSEEGSTITVARSTHPVSSVSQRIINQHVKDDLKYLHGGFDYLQAGETVELTEKLIDEAKLNAMIQVGPYLLTRFLTETVQMWAFRVNFARYVRENTDVEMGG